MKQRKVFLGIPLPGPVARRLARTIEPWQDLPLRWTKERNFHVTLAFIGHIGDESVADLCERVAEAVDAIAPFDVLLEDIRLLPEAGENAQMLWLTGAPNEELLGLHNALESALGTSSADSKTFSPHVTLGRVREQTWVEMETYPDMVKRFSVLVPIDAVTVFESIFEPGTGLSYVPLGVYDLNGEIETKQD